MTPASAAARVRVILNPAAGGGAGARIRARLERGLDASGVDYALSETTGPGHAVRLAAAAVGQAAEIVVAVGGDGTIHEVANGLLDASQAQGRAVPALAVVPTGTGNDFAKVVEGGAEPDRMSDLLRGGTPRRLDVGRVRWADGTEYFVNGMGTGIDVEVVRQIERLPRLPGAAGYLIGLLRALAGYRPIPLRLRLDGELLERRVMIAAIGNGVCIGGGFYVCPAARPDDGRFDVCIINDLGYMGIARTIPRVMRGTHRELPGVEMHQARVIEIEAADDARLFFQLDGELREPVGEPRVRIELLPRRLPVLTRPEGELS